MRVRGGVMSFGLSSASSQICDHIITLSLDINDSGSYIFSSGPMSAVGEQEAPLYEASPPGRGLGFGT